MTQDVLYVGSWNDLLMEPMAGEDGWLDEADAQAHYESPDGVMVVDAAHRNASGEPMPRWVLGFGASGVRAQFFDGHGTRWRRVDYDLIDDRLWRWITADHTYPDDSKRWAINEAVRSVTTTVKPDGSGFLKVVDSADPDSRPTRSTTELTSVAVDAFWLDRPAFGAWDKV
ncbi:MAG: hypothetical protein ACRDTJ_13980, partial [Pseudonocardiaceae bacterium]